MGRIILGTIIGAVVGALIIGLVETISHMIFPPPEGVDLKDPEQLKAIMHTIPFPAKLAVLIAWGLGVFGGGTLGVIISKGKALPATIIAILFLVGAGINLFFIPHPVWMVFGAVIVTALGWYGATRFAKKPA